MSGSDQNLFPSFQVHMNPQNNGALVAIPNYIPSSINKYVSVVCATIPNSFYNCIGAYLLFTNFRFNIPDGQYSVADLCALCKFSSVAQGMHFSLEYSPHTGKVSIVLTDANMLLPSPFLTMLGFTQPELNGAPYSFPGISHTGRADLQVIEAADMADLSGPRNVLIQSNFCIQSEASNKTLAKVPIDVPFGGIVQYKNPNGFRGKIYADDVISNIAIAFVDDAGNAVDFNGVPWSLTLQFDFLRPDLNLDVFYAPDPDLQPDAGVRPDLTLALS